MALSPTRVEYRVTLSLVERDVNVGETIIVGWHPSETAEHLTLRVLAFCLLNEPRLELGPGLNDPDGADLWTRDLTGRLTTWVECGSVSGSKVRKVVQHNSGIAFHLVTDEPRRAGELRAELAGWRPKRGEAVTIWQIDRALVAGLAAQDERRHRWSGTYVGDHLYLDADTLSIDGAITRSAL